MGPTTVLYLDQGNHVVLFLNGLFFPHRQHKGNKRAVRSFISICFGPSLPVCYKYSASFVLSPLDFFSPDYVCSVYCAFLIFVSQQLRSHFSSHLLFLVSLTSCLSSPQVLALASSRRALPPDVPPLHPQLRLN